MTVYPITWRLYLVATRKAGCPLPSNLDGKPVRVNGTDLADDYPVTGVTIDDFDCYIRWLNRTTGQNFRLPTSAEWLVAARTVPAATENWGFFERGRQAERSRNDPREAVSRGTVRPVGRGRPTRDGIFDLEGNGGEATSEYRAGSPKICARFGQRYCREALVLGFDAAWGPARYDKPEYVLQGYPGLSYGYRLVRKP